MKQLGNIVVMTQLREIERLQRGIIAQQREIDEVLSDLEKKSALVLFKIDRLEVSGEFVSPELERAVNMVRARAVSIDKKVPSCDG